MFSRLQVQIQSERELSNKCLVGVCVKLFLEHQEQHVLNFCDEFSQLRVSDEKTDLLNAFLQTLASEMEKDVIFQGNEKGNTNLRSQLIKIS